MMPEEEREKIKKAIKDKDFHQFCHYYRKWTSYGVRNGYYDKELDCFIPIVYLPDTLSIFNGNELVGCASILEKKNFMKIDYEESECG